MNENFIATLWFWAAFCISAGPFWTAIMAAAVTTPFKTLYTHYLLYLIVGWLPLIVIISVIIDQIGSLGDGFNIALHFIGAIIVFWMSYKIFISEPKKAVSFDFNWKTMSLLSWTNPKAWLLIPIGFLKADITDSIIMNITLYYLIGIPFFLSGLYVWGMIGRLGAKISLKNINKFNAFLMFSFGIYLLYSSGVKL